ncbi:MAG: metal-dependent hydrolase [Thermomicrobiales bacterium]
MRHRYAALTLGSLALIAIVLLDRGVVGHRPLVVHGIGDEGAHALTACLWIVGAGVAGVRVVPLAALLGATVIDLDHIPLILDWTSSPPGTSRPETHSLIVLGLLLLLAGWDRSRRMWWGSAALGVASHLWRDLGTGAVVLWWPYSSRAVGIPYGVYLVGVAAVFVGAVFWGMRARRERAGAVDHPVPVGDGQRTHAPITEREQAGVSPPVHPS